jgi:hypothetical protein
MLTTIFGMLKCFGKEGDIAGKLLADLGGTAVTAA